MSKFQRPTNELDQIQTRKLFQLIKQETQVFRGWSKEELNTLSDLGTTLKFFANNQIVRRGEIVEWFGIVLSGGGVVSSDFLKLGVVGVGDLIGYMGVLELKDNARHRFDIIANDDGYISVFYLEDIKAMHRKQTKIVFKFYEMLAYRVLDVMYYQYTSEQFLHPPRIQTTEYSSKKLLELINLHREFSRKVTNFLERLDLKVFLSLCKIVNFEPNQLILKKGYSENALFVVIKGDLAEMQDYMSMFIKEESIFGMEHFLSPGKLWDNDIVGHTHGFMLMVHRDILNEIASRAPAIAVKIYKLLFNLHCSLFIRDKEPKLFLPRDYLSSEELFVELDVGKAVAIRQRDPNRQLSYHPDRSFEDVFFSNQTTPTNPPLFVFYRYNEQIKQLQKPIQKPEVLGSIFLNEKLQKQRLEDEATRKRGKRGATRRSPGKKKMTEEMKKELAKTEGGYIDYVEELEGAVEELKLTKIEHENFKKRIEFLEKENASLKEKLNEEQLKREHYEVKLQKHAVVKDIARWDEIKPSMNSAQQKILNRNFQDIANEQMRAHRKHAITWKYAMKWIEFVKKRKKEREIMERKKFWPGEW
ncbi:unnamed protein product [Blepharisma stoltei]|uniref:Cyclic nucleotide-binding domain-containing protein n=1 Tax=Blepharisma stoltei TaxID=1481888 RepID=A0AAU9IWL8_9CILI|nr:unnamed protein product [Blepharisma stoltei]